MTTAYRPIYPSHQLKKIKSQLENSKSQSQKFSKKQKGHREQEAKTTEQLIKTHIISSGERKKNLNLLINLYTCEK